MTDHHIFTNHLDQLRYDMERSIADIDDRTWDLVRRLESAERDLIELKEQYRFLKDELEELRVPDDGREVNA